MMSLRYWIRRCGRRPWVHRCPQCRVLIWPWGVKTLFCGPCLGAYLRSPEFKDRAP
jgi:hypothetical protein